MPIQTPDFYAVESLFSDDELLARNTAREWVEDRLIPIIGDCYDAGRFPKELVPEMAELGFLGPYIPTVYGGAGLNHTTYGLIMQELERGDSGIRSFASVQSSLCMFPILTFGSEAQKQKFLPAMARGEVIGCYGLTEPDGGSDPSGNMRCRAVRDGDGFVLNGTKAWITNAPIADVAVVWARIEEDGKDTVRGFLVERGTKGFSTPYVPPKLSLRASETGDLVFDDARLSKDAMLPAVRGLKGPLICLSEARFGIAWGAVGAAMACYQEALDFAKERVTFGKPIAAKQLVQRKLSKILADITKHQLLCWRLGQLKDQNLATPEQISLAKRDSVKAALDAARAARDILGAGGITTAHGAMRHACNLESVNTYEGAHDVHTLVLGAMITGERAF